MLPPGEVAQLVEGRMTGPARSLTPMEGIYLDVSRRAYDALEALNFSTLVELAKSPAHYAHRRGNPRTDNASLQRGRLGHICTLEPKRLETDVMVWDGGEKRGKEWAAFKECHAGKEIVKPDELETAMAMAAAVRRNPASARYVKGGAAEVTMVWTVDGHKAKGRPDYLSAVAMVDLKTTRDASPDGFARAAFNYRMHVQAAWYSDGYAAATGKRLPYVVVAVESAPPHPVVVYRVDEDVLALGRAEYRRYLNTLSLCAQQNDWPGYSTGELALTLPRWAYNHDEDDVSELGLEFGQGE